MNMQKNSVGRKVSLQTYENMRIPFSSYVSYTNMRKGK